MEKENAVEMLEKIESTIERLEKEYGGRLLHEDELKYLFPELTRWLSSIISQFDTFMISFFYKENKKIVTRFYTENYSYRIVAQRKNRKNKDEKNLGYLGCQVSNRKPNTGESWTRGKDLADGTYSEQTWINILCDIVNNEIKPLEIKI